ncbi:WXG100 family type VII secretion target [Mycobacterium spongiae]|uniref:ESAT-6-like protein n=1 Tax=Mycobacterium spongiae TaxID=886343 RepID=A0A975K162_9MYCO|nr:WXG100 family type VII secretion target [Mycobacterium spongiae]QUR69467.1 WXG100 family type VII secretion target [Mycobacterium spongiae]
MAAENELRVDPQVMQGFAHSLSGAAEHLRTQLDELNAQVTDMLGGWQGASGGAYSSAWELWHLGASEVQRGLSMLATLTAEASAGYQENEAGAAEALRSVRDG